MNNSWQKITFSLALASALIPAAAYAGYQDGNSGCRIVLCLANPKGPMAESECRQDIKELFYQRTRPHPDIPSCKEAEKSGTYYKFRDDHYQFCPAGYTDSRSIGGLTGKDIFVLDGQEAASLPKQNNSTGNIWLNQTGKNNQTTTYLQALSQYANDPAIGRGTSGGRTRLACVAGSVTSSRVCLEWSDHQCSRYGTIHQYSKVARNNYKQSPQVADVYVNSKIWHRTRLYENDAEVEQKYY